MQIHAQISHVCFYKAVEGWLPDTALLRVGNRSPRSWPDSISSNQSMVQCKSTKANTQTWSNVYLRRSHRSPFIMCFFFQYLIFNYVDMCTGMWKVHMSRVPTAAWRWHQPFWSSSCRAQPLNYLHPLFYDPYEYSQMALSLCLSYLNTPIKKRCRNLRPCHALCWADGEVVERMEERTLWQLLAGPLTKDLNQILFFHLLELDNIIILLWWLPLTANVT